MNSILSNRILPAAAVVAVIVLAPVLVPSSALANWAATIQVISIAAGAVVAGGVIALFVTHYGHETRHARASRHPLAH